MPRRTTQRLPQGTPAGTLHIRLFGEPSVRLADGSVVMLERRAAALLVLAALEPGISRMRAATLLWPESGDPRRNLRQQLLRFRQWFGQDLLTGQDTLTWASTMEPERPSESESEPASEPGTEAATESATEPASRPRPPGARSVLLGTFDFDDCEPFAAWLSQQRLAQQQQWLGAARQRVADSEAAGDLDAALAAATLLLALDEDLEEHHRTLMRLHYLRGDTAAGLAAYQRLRDLLAAHYSTAPAHASEQLAAALRLNAQSNAQPHVQSHAQSHVHSHTHSHTPSHALSIAGSTTTTARAALPVTLTRPPLMAGREQERLAVHAHWAQGQAVLLEGEAGIGKSRLIADLLAGAGPVLCAAGRPGDAGAPYSTLARLLRGLLHSGMTALSASTRDTLGHVTPQLAPPAANVAGHDVAQGAVAAPSADPQAAARAAALAVPKRGAGSAAMAAAVSELLLHHAVQTVALDDVHFADEATLDLLAGLVADAALRWRWLFAGRPAELPAAAQALRASLVELQRLGVVRLSALDEHAVAAVVDTLGIDGVRGVPLAAALVRHTGGNPLFVLETLKHGLLDGSLARGAMPRPASVGSLIQHRLQRLSEPAMTLARVAAIAGADFSIELAEVAIGVRAVHLATAWTELQDAQVLRGESFAHDLVADAALRSVPPVVARRVHAQCAQWLATRGVEPARVARHFRLGGMPAAAGHAFVAAAVRAEQAARLQDEAALYGQAAQAFAEAGLLDEGFDARVCYVRSLNKARFDEQALQECRALARTAHTAAQRTRALSELCGLLTERSEPLAAIETGHAAQALARQLGDDEWQVRTACHMATSLCRLGRADEALALLAPQRAWVDAQSHEPLRMLWHGDWAAALGQAGRLSEAVAAFDVALACARRAALRDAEGRLLLNCSVALRQSGQLDRALAMSRQGQALSAAEMQDATDLPIDALVLARDEAETGHYGRALPALERLQAEFAQRGTGFWAQACRMVLVRLWLDLGQWARAMPLLRDEPADMPAWLRADRRLLQLELSHALGQDAPAGALAEALALALTDAQRGPALRVRSLRHLPPQQVTAQAQDLVRTLRAKERGGALLTLQVHLARAALAEGRFAAAAVAARAAQALLDDGRAPEAMYLPEAHLVAWQAFKAAGASVDAEAALRAGTDWIRSRALPQVPAPFLDSFLRRNAVNRELLAAAAAVDDAGR